MELPEKGECSGWGGAPTGRCHTARATPRRPLLPPTQCHQDSSRRMQCAVSSLLMDMGE
mgnify:CR=1 FL=1